MARATLMRMRPEDLLCPSPKGLYLPARRFPHRPGCAGGPGAHHARPLRPRARRPWRGDGDAADARHHGDPLRRRILPAATQAAAFGETVDDQRRVGDLPAGRPCAGLGADRRRARRHAHRRFRRLQAACRPDRARPSSRSPATYSSPRRRSGCRSSATHRPADEIAKLLHLDPRVPRPGASHRRLCARQGAARDPAAARRMAGEGRSTSTARSRRCATITSTAASNLANCCPPPLDAEDKGDFAGEIVLGPPSAFDSPWVRRFPDPLIAFASGWMQIRQRTKQRGVELPLVISDHCDWDELTATILDTGASRNLGHAWPRGGAGALVRAQPAPRPPAASRRLRGRGGVMHAFADLLERLVLTPSRNARSS